MNLKRFNEITIIGPGLIGASLGLALKAKKIAKKIVGIDTSKKNLKDAIKNESIDEGRLIIDERIKFSEIIFVCTPVSTIDKIVRNAFPFIEKNSIITDVGSVKDCFSKKTYALFKEKSYLVPGHPIAGTEFSGAKYAQKDLFKNKWCILTPKKKNNSITILANIWKKIGMKISIMAAEEHDKIMSITSHLPHLIAFTIVGTAFNIDLKKKKELINFSAGGFKDFTRIGSSDPKMWSDIFIYNKKHILETLNNLLNDLKTIQNLIKNEEQEKIFDLLKKNKLIRKSILKTQT